MYAPAIGGMYLLWNRERLIFIGQACAPDTVLSRLMDHYCGRCQPSQATHCSWELMHSDAWRERFGTLGALAETE